MADKQWANTADHAVPVAAGNKQWASTTENAVPPTDDRSPVTKAGQAFWDWTGKPFMDIMGGASRDPETAKRATDTLKAMGQGLYNEPGRIVDETRNVMDALGAGSIRGAVHHGMKMVPLWGPGIDQAAQDFAQGRPAEGIGHTAAMIVPEFLRGANAIAESPRTAAAAEAVGRGAVKTGRIAKAGAKGAITSIPKARTAWPVTTGTLLGGAFGGVPGAKLGAAAGTGVGMGMGAWEAIQRELNGPPIERYTGAPPAVRPNLQPTPGAGPRTYPVPAVKPNLQPPPAAPAGPVVKAPPVGYRPWDVETPPPAPPVVKPPSVGYRPWDAPPPEPKPPVVPAPPLRQNLRTPPVEEAGGVGNPTEAEIQAAIDKARGKAPGTTYEPTKPIAPPEPGIPEGGSIETPEGERLRKQPEETNPLATPTGKQEFKPPPQAGEPMTQPPEQGGIHIEHEEGIPETYTEQGARYAREHRTDAHAKDMVIGRHLDSYGFTPEMWDAMDLDQKNAVVMDAAEKAGVVFKKFGAEEFHKGRSAAKGVQDVRDRLVEIRAAKTKP